MSRPPQLARASRRGLATVVLICLFGLTGCLKIDVDVSVRGDDTVDGTITAAVRDEAIEILGTEATESFLTSLTEGVPGAAHARPYNDDGFIGKQVRFSGIPLQEFSIPGETRSRDSGLAIRHVFDRYILTGQWDLPRPARDLALGAIDRSILDSARFTVSVTFPGQVSDHNGRLSGRTVTWDLPLGHHHELRAVAAESYSPTAALIVFVACLVVTLIVATLLIVQLRRHSIGRHPPASKDRNRRQPG